MVLTLLTVITIIIIERYVNRSDTKAIDKKESEIKEKKEGEEGFFGKEDGFKRASTARSMTIKLKTLKTQDLDVQGESSQQFLQQMYGMTTRGRISLMIRRQRLQSSKRQSTSCTF